MVQASVSSTATGGSSGRVIAITGAASFLGRKLIASLLARDDVAKIVAIDIFQVEHSDPRFCYYKVDLSLPNTGSLLTKIFTKEKVDTLMHLVFIFSLVRRSTLAHELEAIGTMHLLDACTESGVNRIILRSSTMIYGARPQNHFYISEDTSAAPHAADSFIADKVEAERQLKQFSERHPEVSAIVLREGTAVGEHANNFFLNWVRRPVVPMIVGFDPLMQFIHEDDLVAYYLAAVFGKKIEGTFNVVAPGVIRMSKVLEILGRKAIAVPETLLTAGVSVLWALQLYSVSPYLLPHMKYPLIADGSRAEYTLGVKARYSSQEAVEALARSLNR